MFNGEILAESDEVRRHSATDHILVIRIDELNVARGVLLHQPENLFFLIVLEFVENVDSVVRIHAFDDVRGFFAVEFLDVFFNVVEIGEYFGYGGNAENFIKFQTFGFCQFRQNRRDIVVVIIAEVGF